MAKRVTVTHTRVFRAGRIQHVVIAQGASGRVRSIAPTKAEAVRDARDTYGGLAGARCDTWHLATHEITRSDDR